MIIRPISTAFCATVAIFASAGAAAQVPAGSKPTLDAFTRNIGFTPNMMAILRAEPHRVQFMEGHGEGRTGGHVLPDEFLQ